MCILIAEKLNLMSKKDKSKKSAPMPAMSAGLLRFFEEETTGIKVKPEIVMALAVVLIVLAVIGQLQTKGLLPFF
jgi:preprotein translocase subunit Sec61beta